MNRLLLTVLLGVVLLGFGLQRHKYQPILNEVTVPSNLAVEVVEPAAEVVEPAAEVVEPVVESSPVLWDAPFTTQAPTGNWDVFHEEMCEEASLLIAEEWYRSATRNTIPAAEVETRLTEMAAWERQRLGTDVSTTVQQIAQTATEYLHIPADRVTVATVHAINDLKQLVRQGVVVAPFAGRLLGNPHFTGEGPRYHAAVIIGFTDRDFIVHDVGTRHGAQYHYRTTVLWTALHDYVAEPGQITDGAKTVLLMTRP